MNYGRNFMTLYRRQESRPSPKKEMQKSKMAVLHFGSLTNSCEKKSEDIGGTFHARMSMIEDRNGKDLTTVEDIKKR